MRSPESCSLHKAHCLFTGEGKSSHKMELTHLFRHLLQSGTSQNSHVINCVTTDLWELYNMSSHWRHFWTKVIDMDRYMQMETKCRGDGQSPSLWFWSLNRHFQIFYTLSSESSIKELKSELLRQPQVSQVTMTQQKGGGYCISWVQDEQKIKKVVK